MSFVSYLVDAGAYVYLFLSERDFEYGLIGIGEFETRLVCLRDMLEPNSECWNIVSEQLGPVRGENGRGWPGETEAVEPWGGPMIEGDSSDGAGGAASPKRPQRYFHLLTPQAGVLGEKWKFHQFDGDWYPSVPHGHLQSKGYVKLDAYRGYTYDTRNGQSLARESRAFIINLWNQPGFRAFAVKALGYFATHSPHVNVLAQRGIRHRFRLPRVR